MNTFKIHYLRNLVFLLNHRPPHPKRSNILAFTAMTLSFFINTFTT